MEASHRTPDYDLFIKECRLITEIKEIDNPPCGTKILGSHIRAKIGDAAPQLKRASQGLYPSLLVIYDLKDPGLRWNSEPHDFLAAMHGAPQIILGVPHPVGEVYVQGTKHGPGRKTTDSANTSISALSSLWRGFDGVLRLDIFHNVFAKIPIAPDILKTMNSSQYTVDPENISLLEWVPLSM